jgi:hypothetical protein
MERLGTRLSKLKPVSNTIDLGFLHCCHLL